MTSPIPERRRYPRFEGNIPVKISSDDFDVVTETRNLSCAGAYCRVNQHFDLMTKIKVLLLLPIKKGSKTVTKKISCQGIVVRVEKQPSGDSNIAIFFNDISPKDANCITDYVNSMLAKHH